MMLIYSILLLNVIFLFLTQKRSWEIYRNICKCLFVLISSYALYHSTSVEYVVLFLVSVVLILFLDRESATDILLMPILSLNTYLLISHVHHSAFISFVLYIIGILSLSSMFENKGQAISIFKFKSIDLCVYSIVYLFIYFLGYNATPQLIGRENEYLLYICLMLFSIVLTRSIEGVIFSAYKEDPQGPLYKKYIFKIYLLFALFVLPEQLKILKTCFLFLNADFQDIFVVSIILYFTLSLLREYIREDNNFTIFINIRLVVMNIILLTFFIKGDKFIIQLSYMAIPFVLIHLPCFENKKENRPIPVLKDKLLNYTLAIVLMGLGPSMIFKIKTDTLLFLLNRNIYLFYLFTLSMTLVVVKFLIFFIKNKGHLVQIKNPFYYIVFSCILCIYLFSSYIPDKM